MSETVAEALRRGSEALRRAGVPDAVGDARRLMALALGVVPGRLTLMGPERLPPDACDAFDRHLAERARRRPVSQIAGSRLFWGRAFEVTGDVLDPRPETEMLVAEALREDFATVLDLGTGSGCILVSLLAERPEAQGVGIDASPAALAVAGRNARRHGVGDRARLLLSDWFAAVEGTFNLVVGNPPYVALAEVEALDPEVRDWEPRAALTDGGDGLGAYRVILAGAAAHLAPGGRLILEIGPTQAGLVADMAAALGWGRPLVIEDLDGRDRTCLFRAP